MSLLQKFNQVLTQEDPISFNFCEIIEKIFCFLLVVVCVGLPIIRVYSFIIIFISGLLIVCGKVKGSFKRLSIVSFIVITIIFVKGILPHAALEEGHNIFLLTEDKGALEKGLPKEVFSFMKQEYLKRYPKDNQRRQAPNSVFSFSADSVFSKHKYSRIVDSVDFDNLVEFRGNFVNNADYNWYGASIIKRESMPFFVMYELSPSSVNSWLCWTGYCLWEDSQVHFQTIYHPTKNCRKITSADVGKRVFGVAINNKEQMGFWDRFNALKAKVKVFLSAKNRVFASGNQKEVPLSMHLILSPLLRLSLALKLILGILGAFFILRFKIKVNWRRFILAALIIAIAATVVYFYCPELFGQYYIHEGGEDGITHQTLGSNILKYALSGNWISALRGDEDVFWNTPGFRYFRAIEKLFFGDTNLGYLAVVLILPYVLFGFLTNFIPKKWAFWSTLVFLLGFLPFHILDNLGATYYVYVTVVRGGWPDVLAFTAFLGGLTLAMRYGNLRNGGYLWYGFFAHFLFFVTVFMRPQFCVAALITVLYFAFILFKAKRIKEVLFTWVAFLPVLFPILHNYFFGGKPYLFTGAIGIAVNTPPSVYLGALKELLTFNFSGRDVSKVVLHLKGMIGPWYRAIFLGAVFYLVFLKRKAPSNMRIIAVLCLSLHFVNLFIFATYFRYVFLAWALTVVVVIFLAWIWFTEMKEERC